MVVQQVIILAHGLGMKVVAEGVETADQVELLKEMECDNIQGFYYSRPMSEDDMEAFMMAQRDSACTGS